MENKQIREIGIMSGILKELSDINRIMSKAGFLSKIKIIASKISSTAQVTDGEHEDSNFAVVIKCQAKEFENIHRRFGSVKEVKISKIAEDMLGINPFQEREE